MFRHCAVSNVREAFENNLKKKTFDDSASLANPSTVWRNVDSPVPCIESLVTNFDRALIGFDFSVNSSVNFQTVRRQKSFVAIFFCTFEAIFAPMSFQMRLQIANRTVAPHTMIIITTISTHCLIWIRTLQEKFESSDYIVGVVSMNLLIWIKLFCLEFRHIKPLISWCWPVSGINYWSHIASLFNQTVA